MPNENVRWKENCEMFVKQFKIQKSNAVIKVPIKKTKQVYYKQMYI